MRRACEPSRAASHLAAFVHWFYAASRGRTRSGLAPSEQNQLRRLCMARMRLPVVSAAAVMMIIAAPIVARAQESSNGVYMLDRAASMVSFTLYGSAIFKIKKDGYFRDFTGLVSYNPERPDDTRVDLTVRADSIDTQNSNHDELLKSGEFFDVEHYPTIHFASESTNVRPDGTLSMTGDMTIHGITKRLTIPVTMR